MCRFYMEMSFVLNFGKARYALVIEDTSGLDVPCSSYKDPPCIHNTICYMKYVYDVKCIVHSNYRWIRTDSFEARSQACGEKKKKMKKNRFGGTRFYNHDEKCLKSSSLSLSKVEWFCPLPKLQPFRTLDFVKKGSGASIPLVVYAPNFDSWITTWINSFYIIAQCEELL